jgi:allophycocyanin-B
LKSLGIEAIRLNSLHRLPIPFLRSPKSVHYQVVSSIPPRLHKNMSVVSQVILNADDELRYPTIGELQSIQNFLQTGERRLTIAQTLSENEKKIVDRASSELWRRRPDFIAPGGNAFGQKQRALCLRDYGWYLRLITYGLIAGDKQPIESIGLIGVREMYNALNVPVPGMVEAIRCLKEASLGLLSDVEAQEAAPYFDYIIQAMS